MGFLRHQCHCATEWVRRQTSSTHEILDLIFPKIVKCAVGKGHPRGQVLVRKKRKVGLGSCSVELDRR